MSIQKINDVGNEISKVVGEDFVSKQLQHKKKMTMTKGDDTAVKKMIEKRQIDGTASEAQGTSVLVKKVVHDQLKDWEKTNVNFAKAVHETVFKDGYLEEMVAKSGNTQLIEDFNAFTKTGNATVNRVNLFNIRMAVYNKLAQKGKTTKGKVYQKLRRSTAHDKNVAKCAIKSN